MVSRKLGTMTLRRSHEIMNKKRTAIGCTLAVGILAIIVLNPIGCSILGMFIGMGHIRQSESAMREPRVYETVGN